MPRKLMVVIGTRPEAIKLFPVVHALRAYPTIELRICSTGQHRELLTQVLRFAGIRPDVELDVMRPGLGLEPLLAALVVGIGDMLNAQRPDRLLVQGDTATALAAALCGYHHAVGVSHLEAGLRTGDLARPCPEEGYRRMISAIADQHFAPTDDDARALLREGVDRATIHVTGNTVVDALLATSKRIRADPSLAAGLDPLIRRLEGRRIITVTTHRRESRGGATVEIATALQRLAERTDVAIVAPLHPAAAVRQTLVAMLADIENIALVDPLDYPQFVRLLTLSHLVLTDSGGIQEEAPSFGKPVLVMRDATERPQAVAAGTARLVGTSADRIVSEATRLLDAPGDYAAMARIGNPFGDGRSAARVAALLDTRMSDEPVPARYAAIRPMPV